MKQGILGQRESSTKHTLRKVYTELVKFDMPTIWLLREVHGRVKKLKTREGGASYSVREDHKWSIFSAELEFCIKK